MTYWSSDDEFEVEKILDWRINPKVPPSPISPIPLINLDAEEGILYPVEGLLALCQQLGTGGQLGGMRGDYGGFLEVKEFVATNAQ